MDMGDFVIIINAEKVALTGAKLEQKRAYRHSGYPGGLTSVNYAELLESNPVRAVEKAIRGMLPKNSLAAQQIGQAEGVPRCRAPPRRAAAQDFRNHPGRPVVLATKQLKINSRRTVAQNRRDYRTEAEEPSPATPLRAPQQTPQLPRRSVPP